MTEHKLVFNTNQLFELEKVVNMSEGFKKNIYIVIYVQATLLRGVPFDQSRHLRGYR